MAENSCKLSRFKPKTENLIEEINSILDEQNDLKYLHLSENSLLTIPQRISEFHTLTHLDLSFNLLDNFDIDPGKLPNLMFLDLRSNKLTCIPEGFESLKSLLLNSNQVRNVAQLPSTLQSLDISRNFISDLPENFFKQLEHLKSIDLSFNLLTQLPDVIGPELGTLKCRKNKLSQFPNILQATGLKFLDLSSNSLAVMEEDCFDFQHNLVKILLNDNPLTNLPDLSDLISLTTLDISSTDITRLPTSLASLALLKTLYVVPPFKSISNPMDPGRKSDFEKFVFPPAEIVIKGLEEIQKYLQTAIDEKKITTSNSSETLNNADKPAAAPKKGNLEEFDCLIQEFLHAVLAKDIEQIETLEGLIKTSIHDLLRPHILYVFVNAGVQGGSPILGKFIVRVEKIMSRFERKEIAAYAKSTITYIFDLVESHLLNSMLMKPTFAEEKTLNLLADVIQVWSLFAWEHYSLQTMKLVQDLVTIGKSIFLQNKYKSQTNLTRRQVEKWLSYFENYQKELLELDYLNDSSVLYKKIG